MEQDQAQRASLTHQPHAFRYQLTTPVYKGHKDDTNSPVNCKQTPVEHQTESIQPNTKPTSTPDGPATQSGDIIKSFKITTRPFGFNFTITETTEYQQTAVYYAVGTEFKRKQPDIVLHAGENKDSGRVAVAYFRFSRHVRMGFGSETLSTGEGVWEEMRNTSRFLGHGRYEFEYNVPYHEKDFQGGAGANFDRIRMKFVWERTRDEKDGVRGVVEQHVGWRNYRLVEQNSQKILAVLLTSMFTGCSDKGNVNLHVPLSKELEIMVMLTAMCVCEKGERRIRRYAFGNGANGGL